jgi:centromere protein C
MDIQESTLARFRTIAHGILESADLILTVGSIPDLTTSHQILRNSRTYLPPPRSRSPKKTALGSSPRRQSSMAPRASSPNVSSPSRSASHPVVVRRLDFEQDESSLQETPALSGSGARRGKRRDVYDIPEDGSPVPQSSEVLEESFVQEEITANDDSVVINSVVEESLVEQIGDDTSMGAEAVEDLIEVEEESESQIAPEPVKAKAGRKRKSDVLEPTQDEESNATKSRKRGATSAQASETQKKGKKVAPTPAVPARRSQRVSDITEQGPSILDASVDDSGDATGLTEEVPVVPKRRGRPPPKKSDAEKENAASAKPNKSAAVKAKESPVFKKPSKPAANSKEKSTAKGKAAAIAVDGAPQNNEADAGKLVDCMGKPLSKKDIEQMSTASVASRYGRGRHLSVFRELHPDAVARVGLTGRHRVTPIDFWRNDRISYDTDGRMTSVVKSQDPDSPVRRQKRGTSKAKGKKRALTAIEEEEVELDPWEEEDGTLVGNYKDYDPKTDASTGIIEDSKFGPPSLHNLIF